MGKNLIKNFPSKHTLRELFPKTQENNESKIEAIETEVNDENIDENTTEVAAEENFQYWKTTCQTLYNELKIIVDMHNEKLNVLKAEKKKNDPLALENTNLRAEIAKLNSESGAQLEKHN